MRTAHLPVLLGCWLAAAAPTATAQEPAPADAKPKLSDYDILRLRNPFSPVPEREPRPPTKPTKKPTPKPVKKRATRDEISNNLTLTAIFLPESGGKAPVALAIWTTGSKVASN